MTQLMWQLDGEEWHAISARVQRHAGTVVWSCAVVRLPGQEPKLFVLNIRSGVSVEPKSLDYGRLIISRQILSPEEAATRLLNGTTGPLDDYPDGFSFVKMPAGQTAQAWWLTSGQSWGFGPPAEWPTYFFEWRLMDRDELTWQGRWDDALAKPGLPPYNRAADSIFELIYGTSPSRHPQQLYSQVAVRLADMRARLTSVEMARSKMKVSVEEGFPGAGSKFLLQANWRLPQQHETKHTEQPVATAASFTFDVGVQPLEFGVFLLDPEGNRVDAKTWQPSTGQPAVSVPQVGRWPLKRSRLAPLPPSSLGTAVVPAFSVLEPQASTQKVRAKNIREATTKKSLQKGDVAKAEDSKAVLVVHGRNAKATAALFDYLRALGLRPREWGHLVKQTGQRSPYIGEVLRVAFRKAQAVVVLFTSDDEAQLLPAFRKKDDPSYETRLTPQPRQNVLFEAGMAIGWDESRTIIVEFGERRPFSDIGGRHTIQITNAKDWRAALADRLRNAGCDVDLSGSDWLTAGRFPRRATTGSGKSNDAARDTNFSSDATKMRLELPKLGAPTVALAQTEDHEPQISPERQVKDRISNLVQSRFGAHRLNDDERRSLRATLFEAGRNVEIEFDYQMVQSGEDWLLRFTPDLGAYGVGSDGKKQTLEQLADIHKRLVRTVRSWDEWRTIRK